MASVGEVMGKRALLLLVEIETAFLERNLQPTANFKHKLSLTRLSTSKMHQKKKKKSKVLHAALLIIAETGEQPTCPSQKAEGGWCMRTPNPAWPRPRPRRRNVCCVRAAPCSLIRSWSKFAQNGPFHVHFIFPGKDGCQTLMRVPSGHMELHAFLYL